MISFIGSLRGDAELTDKLEVALQILVARENIASDKSDTKLQAIAMVASKLKYESNYPILALVDESRMVDREIYRTGAYNIEPTTYIKEYRLIRKLLDKVRPDSGEPIAIDSWRQRFNLVHEILQQEKELPKKSLSEEKINLALDVVEKMQASDPEATLGKMQLLNIADVVTKIKDPRRADVNTVITQVRQIADGQNDLQEQRARVDMKIHSAVIIASQMLSNRTGSKPDPIPLDAAARIVIFKLVETNNRGRTEPLTLANYNEAIYRLEHKPVEKSGREDR